MTVRVPRVLNRAVAPRLMSALARTWRIEKRHWERYWEVQTGNGPAVYLIWHESVLPFLWCHRNAGITIVASGARDGIYAADTAHRMGYRSIQGSSARGGAKALLQVVRELGQGGRVAITPDGPRGPRREVHLGGLAAAQRSDAQVIAAVADARPAWRLRSWDRFLVPKPFATVRLAYGEAFRVASGEEGLRRAAGRVEDDMRNLEQELGWLDAVAPIA